MTSIVTFPKSSIRKSFATERLVKEPEVCKMTGRSRAAIWADKAFPRPIKIGKRAIAWRLSDLDEWLNSRETI